MYFGSLGISAAPTRLKLAKQLTSTMGPHLLFWLNRRSVTFLGVLEQRPVACQLGRTWQDLISLIKRTWIRFVCSNEDALVKVTLSYSLLFSNLVATQCKFERSPAFLPLEQIRFGFNGDTKVKTKWWLLILGVSVIRLICMTRMTTLT